MTRTLTDHATFVVVEDPRLIPSCPHCTARIRSISARRLDAIGSPASRFGKRYVYACPSCHKVLGVSHRKGFWMG